MPYNLLILPLVSGYFFLTTFKLTKYKFQRLSSQKLLLSSAITAILISFTTLLLRSYVEIHYPEDFLNLYKFYRSIYKPSQGFEYGWTMFSGFLATLVLTTILNLIFLWRPLKTFAAIKSVQWHGDELEEAFMYAAVYNELIQVTLKNNKVYIGTVIDIPIPQKTNYFDILPVLSGYRDSETKVLKITTPYETVGEILTNEGSEDLVNKMIVTLKQDEVLSISPHDPDVYDRFMELSS